MTAPSTRRRDQLGPEPSRTPIAPFVVNRKKYANETPADPKKTAFIIRTKTPFAATVDLVLDAVMLENLSPRYGRFPYGPAYDRVIHGL